jgi:error-prone DNA polymerase
MAAWRRPGVIDQFRLKLLRGMRERGMSEQFAEQVFRQIRGFGEYGFPESHAASFALLVYASCYLKCHYPAAFCAAILNSQPMGFYAPAQLVADARKHGVCVLPPDVNHSEWDCTLELVRGDDVVPGSAVRHGGGRCAGRFAVRLGLRMIRGLPERDAARIVAARGSGAAFSDLSDVVRRAGLSASVMSLLADADALGTITENRRAALWEALGRSGAGRIRRY